MNAPINPVDEIDTIDKGSDTSKRYHYQASYAATLSLKLLQNNNDFEKIICEQLEDILIKLKNNKYIGCQVKTKEKLYFSFNDPEITNSIIKFIKLEKKYPDFFIYYIIVTNCGFIGSYNFTDLDYCLKQLKLNNNDLLEDSKFQKKIEALSSKTACDKEFVLYVLKKIRVEKLSSLERYEAILRDDIITFLKLRGINNINASLLTKSTKDLVNMAFRKSTNPWDVCDITYYRSLEIDPLSIQYQTVENKSIYSKDVEEILNPLLFPERLLGDISTLIPEKFENLTILEKKMEGGYLYADEISNFKDNIYQVQYLIRQWKYSLNEKKALEYYRHIKTIVNTECNEAYNYNFDINNKFGRKMLIDVQNRLKNRYALDIVNKIPNCFYEDLKGVCGILTENCTVWWGIKNEL